LYIANRGQNTVFGVPKGKGNVSVLDPKTNAVTATWAVPGGGSPDMGNLSPDGSQVVFTRRPATDSGLPSIWTATADGSHLRRLERHGSAPLWSLLAYWSG
jgi:DNA-binding beta-propeller fold protein YncE